MPKADRDKQKSNKSRSKKGGVVMFYEFLVLKAIDLLSALVVVGLLMALALPVFVAQIEKSRAQEAIITLGAIKVAMVRYYQSPMGRYSYAHANFTNIGFNPNIAARGKTPLFMYTLKNLTEETFLCTAQRLPIAGNSGNTVSLDQAGTLTRNGVYR